MSSFRERDAEKLVNVYSDDADWVNAFGTVRCGGSKIVAYLRGLFAGENFNAGELSGPPESRIRVLTPDVLLGSTHLTVKGQKLVSGDAIDRDNYWLRVLQRQPDGEWRIVSEMYNDANTDETYLDES